MRAAAAYLAAALGIASGHEILAQAMEWPRSSQRVVIAVLAAGLPIALALVWLRERRRLPFRARRHDAMIVAASLVLSLALFAAIAPVWRTAAVLGSSVFASEVRAPREIETFRDCPECPEMVVVAAGTFLMGSPMSEDGHGDDEGPQRRVTIADRFAVGRFEVTWSEWEACVRAGGCVEEGPDSAGGDEGWGRGNRPLINASWDDAQSYVRWLSQTTGKRYRLLTEAEWEYAARAGTTTAFYFGDRVEPSQANYDWNYSYAESSRAASRTQTSPTGSFSANAFGLYDMHGNVWEWVEDCYLPNYARASQDGSAEVSGDCSRRVRRGGAWFSNPAALRSAVRYAELPTDRYWAVGLRVARGLGAEQQETQPPPEQPASPAVP